MINDLSQTEENYLKAIFHLTDDENNSISTNAISHKIATTAASVTDMIKKLKDKDLLVHEKYKGVRLTEKGRHNAIMIIRKHRLWETFMVEKLDFNWDEVHEVAEQLEHIKSPKLVDSIDRLLNHPRRDPHGDPIPDKNGQFPNLIDRLLADCKVGDSGYIQAVKEHSTPFLKYLESQQLLLGNHVEVIEFFDYDDSFKIRINRSHETIISKKVSEHILLT